jgi:hypothetical protein
MMAQSSHIGTTLSRALLFIGILANRKINSVKGSPDTPFNEGVSNGFSSSFDRGAERLSSLLFPDQASRTLPSHQINLPFYLPQIAGVCSAEAAILLPVPDP